MDLMDRHVAWLKRVALSRTLVRLTLEAVLAGDLALLGLIARGTDRWVAIPWALVAGVAFAILRFVLALNINPVSYSFIKRFSEERINHQIEVPLDLVEPTIEDSAASFLNSVNMEWVATVGDDAGRITPLQIYRTDDRVVLGAIADDGSEPMFLSRLADGRIIVSSTTFMPFRQGLIVNMVRRGRLRTILESHVDALDLAIGSGGELGRVDADAVMHVLSNEQESWMQLGPFVGPFVSVSAKWKPHLLHTRFSPSRMLEMSIAVPVESPVMHLASAPAEIVEDGLVESEDVEIPEVDEIIEEVAAAESVPESAVEPIPMPETMEPLIVELTADAQDEAWLPEPAPLWPLPEPVRHVEPAPVVLEYEPVEVQPVLKPEPVEVQAEPVEMQPEPVEVEAEAEPDPVEVLTPSAPVEPLPQWATTAAAPLVIGRRAGRDAA